MSNLVIPNNGTIGSVSDTDAISIASDGGLTFSGGVDNAGTISAGTLGSSVVFPAGGTGNPISIAIVGDKKSVDSGGGGYTADTWSKRTLNFEEDPDTIVTYTSNEFTLSAGTYFVDWSTMAFYCNSASSRLYNETDSSVVRYGTDAHPSHNRSSIVDHTNSNSLGSAVFSITGTKNFSIQFYPDIYDGNNGGAPASVSGFDAFYTLIKIIKLK